MKKIGEIAPVNAPKMVIYYDSKERYNHYKVYLVNTEQTECGLKQCRLLVIKYADLLSCGHVMLRYMEMHNEDGRT